MKIDIDRIKWKDTRFLVSFRKPFEIRAGNKGINVRSDCPGCPRTQDCYECWVYVQFDDPNRLRINRTQKEFGLPNNVLWDIKRGKEKPGKWETIYSEQDIDRFLRKFTGFW